MFRVLAAAILFLLLVPSAFAADSSMLLPTSVGNYSAWTPSTGTTHYTLVDETPCNGVADYNSTTVVGNRDSYGVSLASIPDGVTITAINIKPCASNNTSGGSASTMNVFYRLNGTNSSDGGAYATTGTTPVDLATTTFGGLLKLKNASSTLEIGAVYSAGTKGVRLSRIATVITYTIAPQQAPTVTTEAVSFSGASTTLNGTANPNGFAATGWFRYSTSTPGTCNDSFGTRAPLGAGGVSLGSGTSSVAFNRSVTGLAASTTYYYCAIASNPFGTSTGSVVSFVTN
jgi:hypothetical protein